MTVSLSPTLSTFSVPTPSAPSQNRVIHLRNYLHNIANTPKHQLSMSHSELESKLWRANCFIIPLIVYPILSFIGHMYIQINWDQQKANHNAYIDQHQELFNYLEKQTILLGSGEIELDRTMQKSIFAMLKALNFNTKDALWEHLAHNDQIDNHNASVEKHNKTVAANKRQLEADKRSLKQYCWPEDRANKLYKLEEKVLLNPQNYTERTDVRDDFYTFSF